MSARLRLVIFDVDGTLVDSQGSILAAMQTAFARLDLPAPDRSAVLSIVGLSLDRAMQRLAPDLPASEHDALVDAYKQAYFDRRQTLGEGAAPLYPGALEVLEALSRRDDMLLGVATGKSRRGLNAMLQAHGLERAFVTRQVADDHPSKPHPSMILTAMAECGVQACDTVMIGDTSFDMEMAQAAGVAGIGVSWGYHAQTELRRARRIIDHFRDLPPALNDIWAETT